MPSGVIHGVAQPNPFRHWLATLNFALGLFLVGAFAAPTFAAVGWQAAADWLYTAYRFACHEWAFRSFFLFGAGTPPLVAYDQYQLSAITADPFGFVGNANLGWKMAFCERDLAIYAGLLVVGVLYARRRSLAPLGFAAYMLLALPMAIDGFTQLFGWRESTWQLRVVTGLLFGVASAWLVAGARGALAALRRRAARPEPLTGLADEAVVGS